MKIKTAYIIERSIRLLLTILMFPFFACGFVLEQLSSPFRWLIEETSYLMDISNGTPDSVKAYCGIKPNGNFEIGKDNWYFCGTLHIHPATEEQRDLLFQKMKEAGYTWDAEKKELKKIEVICKESENERIRKAIIEYFGGQ